MQTKILRGPTTPDEIILLIAHVTCLKRHDPKNECIWPYRHKTNAMEA